MTIAILQPLGLGDGILSLSIVQTLKQTIPEAKVMMVVRRTLIDIVAHHPDVHSVIPIRNEQSMARRFFTLVSELSDLSCDTAIICPGSLTVALAAAAARIPRRIGSDQTLGLDLFAHAVRYPRLQYQTDGAFLISVLDRLARRVNRPSIASLLFTDVVPFTPASHAIERFCSLLHPLGIYTQPVPPKIYSPLEEIANPGDETVIRGDAGPIALVPGSRWATKRWGETRYAQLAVELTKKYPEKDILLCGHTDDSELCGKILELMDAPRVKNISGRFSLLELSGIFRRCAVVIGNDSGAGHCAAAVGTPVVTLFGPTIPGFGFTPLSPKSEVCEGVPLECRPCGPYGGSVCPVKSHECMTSISVESVVNAVERIIH